MSSQEKTSETPKVIVKKVIPASRERVFDAWTKADLMQQWFFPGQRTAKTTNDLRVGGSYSHDMISDGKDKSTCSHNEDSNLPKHHLHTGEYLEIKKPEKLVFTWNSPAVQNTRVTIQLLEIGEATEVIITHELIGTEELRKGHTDGWNGCLENLSIFLG